MQPQPPDWHTGKTVAVVGSGPAGLACAYFVKHGSQWSNGKTLWINSFVKRYKKLTKLDAVIDQNRFSKRGPAHGGDERRSDGHVDHPRETEAVGDLIAIGPLMPDVQTQFGVPG